MESKSNNKDIERMRSKSKNDENMAEQSGSAVGFDKLFQRASSIVEKARSEAYRYVNEALVRRNWLLGKLIAEEELLGEERATYGLNIIRI